MLTLLMIQLAAASTGFWMSHRMPDVSQREGALWQMYVCLQLLVTFGSIAQLYRRLRREEMARYAIEAELTAERAALEQRVEARTLALENEVRERQQAERLNRGRNRMLEMVAINEPTTAILKVLTETVADFHRHSVCTLHGLEGKTLALIASAGLNAPLAGHLESISADLWGAPESVALLSRRPFAIEDLDAEQKAWSGLLRANGLISAWSAPFLAPNGDVLGTLTIYTRLRWTPSAADAEMLEMACNMASLVLERSRLQAQLIEHAYHDSLTGMPNRRLGEDRLAQAINRSARSLREFAVLWIDLNRFKQINDHHGHPVGDAVLRHAALRIAARLRTSDTLARMGGDEFMVIVEGCSRRDEAEEVACDLLAVLSEPLLLGQLELSISASIGIALYPEDGRSVDTLAHHADQAMYVAKASSSGFRSFSAELFQQALQRRELETELRHGLEADGFSMAYQPICRADGTLVRFEALLRFNSPRLGNVPPSQFIQIAEECHLIVPLGEWVLRQVCAQSRAWQAGAVAPVPIAVNISALQFAREDFADTVAEILAESKRDGSHLILELTESFVMRNFAESARQMKRLKQLGVRIAIDDFGTGYSSLSYLHRLPIDVLKIDHSFMENLNEPDGTGPIVEAVISMAHTLNLHVVAEGVETAEQLSMLQESGCDLFQGYFFCAPVEPAIATQILLEGQIGDLRRSGLVGPDVPLEERPIYLALV